MSFLVFSIGQNLRGKWEKITIYREAELIIYLSLNRFDIPSSKRIDFSIKWDFENVLHYESVISFFYQSILNDSSSG